MIRADIKVSGPLFDGRADIAIDDFCRDVVMEVGAQGLSYVHQNLDRSIRFPTPYYETQVLVERETPRFADYSAVVHDRGIIYGPWLEGIGSRNKTTRFKGYFAFRRATQTLRGNVGRMIERKMYTLTDRIN